MNPDLADALQALVAVAIESTVGLEDHTQAAAVADVMKACTAQLLTVAEQFQDNDLD
tara:strand:+ start:111 stop:281 length:171 start_codon:yes stop_codon:yes gene_type:complete